MDTPGKSMRVTNGRVLQENKLARSTGEIENHPDYIKDLIDYPNNAVNGTKKYNFPKRISSKRTQYGDLLEEYSYLIDFSPVSDMKSNMDIIHSTSNIDLSGNSELLNKNSSYFNRFKLPFLGDVFSKGFGHIFFTRPNCNILNYKSNGKEYSLVKSLENDMMFSEAFNNHLPLLKQLCLTNEYTNDFMMYLSNKATGFSIADKQLDVEAYGKNMMGHQVQIGKHTERSKTAGTISIPYTDTRNLDIYNLHNLWVHYISGIYRGKYRPRASDIFNKILDYACSVYFMITAENFETIVYWTKLYGVFPTMTPDSVLDWKQDSGPIKDLQESIEYAFSWRSEDNDPKVLVDFNTNSSYGNPSTDFKYMKTYQDDVFGPGTTWVGAPFVEKVTLDNGTYEYRLRWREY
ncbi:MAG TPA: hypothetical protein DCW90_04885 [Lachnospiraceae bacterium]|nr:hypothetical protein [Lachnospiraceae bacterium]